MGEALQITQDVMTAFPAQVAARWASEGFPVFPCGPDKRPLTPNGFKDATTDTQLVAAFWRAHPKALIGIPTGQASGLFVVDLDTDRDTGECIGEASLAALGLDHLVGQVATVATPSGGRHLYFRDCGLGNSASKLGHKIDTRGDGGYVIGAGSMTPRGAYRLIAGTITRDTLTSVPEAILARLRGKPPEVKPLPLQDAGNRWVEAALHGELGRVMAARAGERNHALNRAAFALGQIVGGGGLDAGSTHARLLSAAKAIGLTDAEADATIKSGMDAGMADPRAPSERRADSAGPRVNPRHDDPTPSALPEFFPAAALHGREVPDRMWHVEDMIPARQVTILTGDGGTGKSLVALQLATATALGRQWLGQITTAGPALFISAEDDRDELHRRVAALSRAEGVSLADLDALTLCSLAGEDALLSVPEGVGKTMKETPLFLRIDEWIEKHRPTLTILDTLADLFGGDEINRGQARQFIGQLRALALKHETTILLLAHPSLSGMARGDGNSGSTAWNNSVRSRLYLRRNAAEDGAIVDPDARTLEVMKSNYSKVGAALSLRYRDGAFIWEPDRGGMDSGATVAKADRVFMKLLKECQDNGRRVNHTGGNSYAPKVFAAHPDAEGVTRKAFHRAMETALARGLAVIETEGPPSRKVSYIVPSGAV